MTKTAAKQAHVDSQTTRTRQRTPETAAQSMAHNPPPSPRDEGPWYDFYKSWRGKTPANAIRLAIADHVARDGMLGDFTSALREAERIVEDAPGREKVIADLVAALRDATAYVELFTDKGVREQPSADVRLPNGDFDAEQIAFNGRAALAKAQSHD